MTRASLLLLAIVLADPAAGGRDTDNTQPYEVSTQLRYRVIIGKILYLRIGDANGIERVEFDLGNTLVDGNQPWYGVPPTTSGSPVNAVSNNSAGQGAVNVELRSNVGSVELSATVSGGGQGLLSAEGDTIDFSEITSTSSDNGLAAPILNNSGGSSITISGNVFGGRAINRNAVWTYQYANSQSVPAGLYEGRITYTATSP
ncbi:hypothetical protein OAS86_07270 [Gammaproteobacteria bacterium]|nr:hypothetical protein [Gammaproteobacteria bacterium]